MGRLAGGIAHDFNNLLGIILGYASIIRNRVREDDPVATKALQIQRAGERAAGLTRQLLAFSSRQMLRPEVMDLGALVRDAEKMLGRLIGEDVELVSRVGPSPFHVKADPSQLEQVLMNLVVNARDAMPEGGRLVVQVADVEIERPEPVADGVLQPGRYVVLSVSDTGVGIRDEVRAHLFEPFFTTKEPGKGTGLGLATVHGIVEQSGGSIAVDSAPGEGATFRIYLPRVDPEPAPRPEPASPPRRGGETILVVEDEEPLLAMTREILSDAGYHVLEAGSGARALEVAASHAGPIHLLLTDVVMPGLSGPRTAEQLGAIRPETRVLFASGYTAGELGPHGVLDPGVELLAKPYSPSVLRARIRTILDR
jgi:CheY-like chemotaxis protein